MTPNDLLRQAILEDKFPEDAATNRLFTPQGEDGLKLNRNIAVSEVMTRATGRDVIPGSIGWQGEKDAFAQGFFKMPAAKNVSDGEIHGLVRRHLQSSDASAQIAVENALAGKALPDAIEAFNVKAKDAPEGLKSKYTDALIQQHMAVELAMMPYRKAADEIAGELGKEMESALPTTDKFKEVAERLMAVPEDRRRLVIKAIGATGGATAEERASYLSKIAGAMGRMSEQMGSSVESAMRESALTETVVSLQEAGQMDYARKMEGEIDRQDEFRLLTQMVRDVADQEISPIKSESWAGQLGIDLARMIPQTAVTVANPAMGFAANVAYFDATQTAQVMLEDPSLTLKQARAVVALSAPASAAAETMTALIPFGRVPLPFLGKFLRSATTTTAGGLTRLGIRAAAGTAGEIGEEGFQAMAPLWSQGLLSALSQDMPEVDWENRMPDFSKIAKETWAPALVFSLVGAGAASISEVKSGRTLAADVDLMIGTGILPETAAKIKEASDAGNFTEVDRLFRQDFDAKGDQKATDEQRVQAVQRFQERVKVQEAAQALSDADSDYVARVIRAPSGWAVEMADGRSIPATSQEAAQRIATDLKQESSIEAAEALVAVIDDYHLTKRGANAETVLTGEDVVGPAGQVVATRGGKVRAFGAESLETIRKQAENIGIQTDTQDVFIRVNGSNEVFPRKVAKGAKEILKRLTLFQSSKGGQPQVITFLHENFEADVQLGLANGTITEQEIRTAFAALAPALDPKKARNDEERRLFEDVLELAAGRGDATKLRETFSEMGVRDLIARDRKNQRTGMRPGSISRALVAAAMSSQNQQEATAIKRVLALLRAFSAYLKGVLSTVRAISKGKKEGKVGQDWDALVDKLLGLDETTALESQAIQEAQEIVAAGNMAFSTSRATPDKVTKVTEMPDGAQLVGPTTFSIQAYHGTPHKVDKFSLDKIGTGEGAQAYGWGLYFAQSKGVAQSYQDALGARNAKPLSEEVLFNGKLISDLLPAIPTVVQKLITGSIATNGSLDAAASALATRATALSKMAADAIKLLDGMTVTMPPKPGNLYTVEILPDEEEFLDWDKPLSEHPESIQQKLTSEFKKLYQPDMTVGQWHAWMMDGETDAKTLSGDLAALGIPGIKYLDGGSRGKGDGTRNFVIFDENLVKILEENGKPVSASSFSISAIKNLDELSEAINSRMSDNPVEALRVKSRVQRNLERLRDRWSADRWTWKGDRIRPISEKATVKELNGRQRFIQRSAQRRLMDEGMLSLTPETIMAYDEGVRALEDDPLISRMLGEHGRLMSKSTAEEQGKDITDQYDDSVWIPPAWYSSGSGITPDVMANNLGFDTVSQMWAALESSIKSARTANEAYKKAEAAVKAIHKEAFQKSKEEAKEWREEADAMQAEDWNPRASLIRDLVTLEALIATLPAEIRGKVGGFVALARKGTEKARLAELQKRVDKMAVLLEKHLKDEYGVQVEALLDRYKSQKDKGGRMSGKLLSTATEQVSYAAAFVDMDVEAQAEATDHLEKVIEESDDTAKVQDALNKLGIARLFELWSDKDSASRASAFEWLQQTIKAGKEGKAILDADRKAFLDEMRSDAVAHVTEGAEVSLTDAENAENQVNSNAFRKAASGFRGLVDSLLWTAFHQLEIIFGADSKVYRHFSDEIIRGANRSIDIKRAMDAERKEAMQVIFNSSNPITQAREVAKLQKARKSGVFITEGRKTETITLDLETLTKLSDGTMTAEAAGLREDQARDALEEFAANDRKRTIKIENVTNAGRREEKFMSEGQGIQYWLWWNQADSKKQMERDGWDEESIQQLDAFLSPEAKELGRWMTKSYDDAASLIDPIYRRLFNAPLPRVKNYAPIYRVRSGSTDVMDLDSAQANSGLAAGFTKSRVNTTSSLAQADALMVFLTHWEHVAHWVANAELVRDMKAVLLDKSVTTAIRAKAGVHVLPNLKERVAKIENSGNGAARELMTLSKFWNRLIQFRAFKSLAFKLSPIAKQTPAFLNPLLADISAAAYSAGMARAFASPAEFARNVAAMWQSPTIRRRIESGYSAEARLAMQGEGVNSSVAIALMQRGMMPMSYTDAGWTTLGAAIAFDHYKRQAMRVEGMTEELANAEALQSLERMIATSAQPTELAYRALIENSSHPFTRSMWMFASEPRKNLAIELMAIRRILKGKGSMQDVQRVIVSHVLMAGMSQLMAGFLATMLGDDDDQEREWSREQWGVALGLGPINGLFVFGRVIESAIRRLVGLRQFPNPNLAEKAAEEIYRGAANMDDLFSGDADEVMTEIDRLSGAAATGLTPFFGPQAGVADVMLNLAREARKMLNSGED